MARTAAQKRRARLKRQQKRLLKKIQQATMRAYQSAVDAQAQADVIDRAILALFNSDAWGKRAWTSAHGHRNKPHEAPTYASAAPSSNRELYNPKFESKGQCRIRASKGLRNIGGTICRTSAGHWSIHDNPVEADAPESERAQDVLVALIEGDLRKLENTVECVRRARADRQSIR